MTQEVIENPKPIKKGWFRKRNIVIAFIGAFLLWNYVIDPKVPKEHKMTHELQAYVNSPPPRPNYNEHLKEIVLKHHPLGSNVYEVEEAFEKEGWECNYSSYRDWNMKEDEWALSCLMSPFPVRFAPWVFYISSYFKFEKHKITKADVQQPHIVTLP